MEEQHYKGELLPVAEEKSFIKKAFTTILMLVALVGFGALGWLAYLESRTPLGYEQLPVLKADKTPFKIKPKNPGGMKIPNKDKEVYNTITAGRIKNEEEEVVIQPPPEEPVNLKKLKKLPAPFLVEKKEKVVNKVEAVKKVEKKKAAKPTIKVIRNDRKVATKPALPKRQARVETKKANQHIIRIYSKPRYMAEKKAPKDVNMQLGSYRDSKSLHLGWIILQRKYPAILGDLRMSTQPVEIEGKGSFYRLYAGPVAGEGAAHDLCTQLVSKGQDCLVVK